MMRDLLRGALGGVVATVPMSAVVLGAQRAGLVGELPPKKISDALVDSLGVDPDEATRVAVAIVNHFGFGAAMGALYGVITPARTRPMSALLGAAFGVGVWAASYRGWVPRLGIMPYPEHDRPGRPAVMIAAHVVFGAVLGAIAARRRERHVACVDPSHEEPDHAPRGRGRRLDPLRQRPEETRPHAR